MMDGQEFEMQVIRHLFGIAGLTEADVRDLIGAQSIAPSAEDYAKVPPTPVGASDSLYGQAYRLAQAHAMIRLALEEKSRRRERAN